jgi:3-deoxy-D-arabino-heptulosonate 7-phosphate (DAHP) synthase class II
MNTIRKNANTNNWSPDSWKALKISQQPTYKNPEEVEKIVRKVKF